MIIFFLLIGLPGSGKTWFAHNNLKGIPFFDDIVSLDELPPMDWSRIQDIAIADVNFCDAEILEKAKTFLREKYQNVVFHEIYFENDPVKARANVLRRNDGRNVEGTIKRFTAIYNPPATALPIYSP